jgi:hypothetical protein
MSLTRRCEAEGERRRSSLTRRPHRLRPIRWTVGSLLGLGLLVIPFHTQGRSLLAPPTPTPPGMPNPRLDAPQLSDNPTQLERGAYAFWLYCLPCHGDRGQGLTDEFRQLYPPDHQNCWASGCHGERPYPNGWTLPPQVPALIGAGALVDFPNAAALHAFVRAAMPFEAPGSLDADTYWDVVAFLAEKNGGLPDGQVLNPGEAAAVPITGSPAAAATPAVATRPALPESPSPAHAPAAFWATVLLGLLVGAVFLARDLRRQ